MERTARASLYSSTIRIRVITSPGAVALCGSRRVMLYTALIPVVTLPKTEWQDSEAQFFALPSGFSPSRKPVSRKVMKNWLPFVLWPPAFAIERTPGPSWRRSGWNSLPKR